MMTRNAPRPWSLLRFRIDSFHSHREREFIDPQSCHERIVLAICSLSRRVVLCEPIEWQLGESFRTLSKAEQLWCPFDQDRPCNESQYCALLSIETGDAIQCPPTNLQNFGLVRLRLRLGVGTIQCLAPKLCP